MSAQANWHKQLENECESFMKYLAVAVIMNSSD
jgi:hypothetical protein